MIIFYWKVFIVDCLGKFFKMKMIAVNKIAFVFIFLLMMGFVFCEPNELPEIVSKSENKVLVLNLDESVRLALENNKDIKILNNVMESAKFKYKTSWNSISPTASLNGTFADDFEKESSSFSLSGTVNAKLSPNLATSIKSAGLNYESAKFDYEQKKRDIELSVRKSFYGLLSEKENLLLRQRNLETAQNQYERNLEKFKSGQMSELDVFTSQVSYEQKKPEVELAQISIQNNLDLFKQLLGIDMKCQIDIYGSLEGILNMQSLKGGFLDEFEGENSGNVSENVVAPSIRQSEINLEKQKNNLLSSRFSALAPSVSASYSYGKSKYDSESQWNVSNKFSVGVNIPLDGWLPWSSGAVQCNLDKTNLLNARETLEKTKIDVGVKKNNYIRQIKQLVSQIDSLNANVELGERTYEMTKTAYNYGKTDLQNLMNAADSVFESKVALKKQTYNILCYMLDLEELLGLEFGILSGEKNM